jgi:hypothetical protein
MLTDRRTEGHDAVNSRFSKFCKRVHRREKCILIDVATPADRNTMQKEAEKKRKHSSLCIEIQRMWNVKCMRISAVIGAAGIVTKRLKKYSETSNYGHSN